jgi:hypothetical protein
MSRVDIIYSYQGNISSHLHFAMTDNRPVRSVSLSSPVDEAAGLVETRGWLLAQHQAVAT